jgi:hypothetical protein
VIGRPGCQEMYRGVASRESSSHTNVAIGTERGPRFRVHTVEVRRSRPYRPPERSGR